MGKFTSIKNQFYRYYQNATDLGMELFLDCIKEGDSVYAPCFWEKTEHCNFNIQSCFRIYGELLKKLEFKLDCSENDQGKKTITWKKIIHSPGKWYRTIEKIHQEKDEKYQALLKKCQFQPDFNIPAILQAA